MIATTSTAEKAELARGAGADETIGYDEFGSGARATGGGPHVVYDAIGKDTFEDGMAALRAARAHGALRHGERAGAADSTRSGCRRSRSTSPGPGSRSTSPRARSCCERAGEVLGWVADGTLDVRSAGATRWRTRGRRTRTSRRAGAPESCC